MSYNKEYAIASQNAATAAATLLSGTGASYEEFERTRTAIFNGTIHLAGAETIVQVFEAETPSSVTAQQVVQETRSEVTAGGPRPNADLAVNSGKHAGKTLAQIQAVDPGWLEWASTELRNDFLRTRVKEFLGV